MVMGLVFGSVPSAATEIAAGAQPFLPAETCCNPLGRDTMASACSALGWITTIIQASGRPSPRTHVGPALADRLSLLPSRAGSPCATAAGSLQWAQPRAGRQNFPVRALAAAIATVPGLPASVESPAGRAECDDATDRGAVVAGGVEGCRLWLHPPSNVTARTAVAMRRYRSMGASPFRLGKTPRPRRFSTKVNPSQSEGAVDTEPPLTGSAAARQRSPICAVLGPVQSTCMVR